MALVAVLRSTAPDEVPVSVPAVIAAPALWVIGPAVRVKVPPPVNAPANCSAVEPLFSVTSPPAAKAPKLLMALVAVLRSTAPDEPPVRVPAAIAAAAVWVIAPAFRVSVWPAALIGAVTCRALVPLFSAKSPPRVKAPKSLTALVAALRSTVPEGLPVNMPVLTVPAAVCDTRPPPVVVKSTPVVPLTLSPSAIPPLPAERAMLPGVLIGAPAATTRVPPA